VTIGTNNDIKTDSLAEFEIFRFVTAER